jgi:hypothetical protein
MQANGEPSQSLHQQESKKYALHTTFKDLEKGVTLYTEASGALIRISAAMPAKNKALHNTFKPIFYIKTKQSPLLPLQQASQIMASDEDLENSYFANNAQTILELKPELGAGAITLTASPAPGHENDPFVVHVFDKNATTTLTIKTNKANYQLGEKLTTTVTLGNQTQNYPIQSLTANLISPQGEKTPLQLKAQNGDAYQTTIPLNTEKNNRGDTWYVETQVSTTLEGNIIQRQAHTAFSYAIPSATIYEVIPSKDTPFTFTANLKVATGSRYALQAVLYTRDPNGKKTPIEVAQSAAWLSPGDNAIVFAFSPENKDISTQHFYLGQLQLIDYGQIKTIFRYNSYIPINPA